MPSINKKNFTTSYNNVTSTYIYAILVLISIVDAVMFIVLPLYEYIYFGLTVILIVIVIGIWYYLKIGKKKSRGNMKVFFFNSATNDEESIRNLENNLDKYRTEAKLDNNNMIKLLTVLMILYDYYAKKVNDEATANKYRVEALQILNSENFPITEEAIQVKKMAESVLKGN